MRTSSCFWGLSVCNYAFDQVELFKSLLFNNNLKFFGSKREHCMMNELYFSLQQNFCAELKTAVSWNTSMKQGFVGGVGDP